MFWNVVLYGSHRVIAINLLFLYAHPLAAFALHVIFTKNSYQSVRVMYVARGTGTRTRDRQRTDAPADNYLIPLLSRLMCSRKTMLKLPYLIRRTLKLLDISSKNKVFVSVIVKSKQILVVRF